MNTNRTALVAGAGLSGLAAGLALAQAGREPVVLDPAPALQPLRGTPTLSDSPLAAPRRPPPRPAVRAAPPGPRPAPPHRPGARLRSLTPCRGDGAAGDRDGKCGSGLARPTRTHR